MKHLRLIASGLLLLAATISLSAQEYQNYISCLVDGEEYIGKAQRLRIPTRGMDYLAVAAFKTNPDVEVWIRIFYLKDSLKVGTYEIVQEETMTSSGRKKQAPQSVWVLVDYSQETSKFGHDYHNGESLEGTLTITQLTDTSIEGTFDVTLRGVYFQKRPLATISGTGIRSNIERKIITQAGGGMLAKSHPHELPNTRKGKETDTIVLSNGKFKMDWTKGDKGE
jgi:hypothetical protein